jgi:hypothetical protein
MEFWALTIAWSQLSGFSLTVTVCGGLKELCSGVPQNSVRDVECTRFIQVIRIHFWQMLQIISLSRSWETSIQTGEGEEQARIADQKVWTQTARIRNGNVKWIECLSLSSILEINAIYCKNHNTHRHTHTHTYTHKTHTVQKNAEFLMAKWAVTNEL